MRGSRVRQPFLHEPFDLGQVLHHLALLLGVLCQLGAQFHARDRRLQIVRDGRQDLHALLDELGDALAHGIERPRGAGQLGGACFGQRRRLHVGIERIRGIGQCHQRPDRHAYGEPAAPDQQQQLDHQHIGQPLGDREHARMHVDGQGAAVAQRQVRLHLLAVAWDRLHRDGKAALAGLGDPLGNILAALRHLGHARRARPQYVLIVAAIHARQPLRTLGGGNAVEDGNRGGHVGFQRAEHDFARCHVSLGEQHAKRQTMRDHQPGKQDQEQARTQRARPGPEARAHCARCAHGAHWRASLISTGIAST